MSQVQQNLLRPASHGLAVSALSACFKTSHAGIAAGWQKLCLCQGSHHHDWNLPAGAAASDGQCSRRQGHLCLWWHSLCNCTHKRGTPLQPVSAPAFAQCHVMQCSLRHDINQVHSVCSTMSYVFKLSTCLWMMLYIMSFVHVTHKGLVSSHACHKEMQPYCRSTACGATTQMEASASEMGQQLLLSPASQ